jgi:putative endonuclease
MRKTIMARTDRAKTDGAAQEKAAKTASPARIAESRAAALLMAKGYRILAKRFRTPHGEIDIVTKRRKILALVEVKARASLDEAAFAVTPRQQARIINAAQAWLARIPNMPNSSCVLTRSRLRRGTYRAIC